MVESVNYTLQQTIKFSREKDIKEVATSYDELWISLIPPPT